MFFSTAGLLSALLLSPLIGLGIGAVPTSTSPSFPSGRTKCSQEECPKFCDLGSSTAKRSVIDENVEISHLDKRFYENSDKDKFPYGLLGQSYTKNICPPEVNSFIWKRLDIQRGQYAAALEGLCGCTTIFVASAKGVFSSHIWEQDDNTPPRDLQANNYQATLNDLKSALGGHKDDLKGGKAYLIVPTNPDSNGTPNNPDNYLYGTEILNAINKAISDSSGLQPRLIKYNPLDFKKSTILGTNRQGTFSFEFDPNFGVNGKSTRAFRVIAEGNLIDQVTGL